MEAWHQKLHTNTTQEDITVCEAYIAFLESGDIGTYSRVLWENGGISREDMANKWDRKIPGKRTALAAISIPTQCVVHFSCQLTEPLYRSQV